MTTRPLLFVLAALALNACSGAVEPIEIEKDPSSVPGGHIREIPADASSPDSPPDGEAKNRSAANTRALVPPRCPREKTFDRLCENDAGRGAAGYWCDWLDREGPGLVCGTGPIYVSASTAVWCCR